MSERLDVEDVRGTSALYRPRAPRSSRGFGGTVEKFIGDAVTAVFGAPIAREDDAERAVRAGLASATPSRARRDLQRAHRRSNR